MKIKKLLFLVLILSGCALELKQNEPFEVKDVTVHHIVNWKLDFDKLKSFFLNSCSLENPGFTEEELDTCADIKVSEFLDALTSSFVEPEESGE